MIFTPSQPPLTLYAYWRKSVFCFGHRFTGKIPSLTRCWIVQPVIVDLQGCSLWKRAHRKTAYAVGRRFVEDHDQVFANLIVDDLTALQNIHRIRFGNLADHNSGNKRMLPQPLI